MFKNGRQPERNTVASGHGAEIANRQQNYIVVTKGLPNTVGMNAIFSLLFVLQFGVDPGPLVGRKPSSPFRPVSEIKNGKDPKQHSGDSLDDEQPAPALQSKPRDPEQETGQRRADDIGNGIGRIKHSNRFCSILIAEPMGQIHNDAWEKTGLGGTHKKAHQIELALSMNESH